MNNSYRFYSNRDCKYFPCHEIKNPETFNCMFCYCPLYLLDDCGGNQKEYKGIKDCSGCMIPHSEKGYDYINEKLKQVFEAKKHAREGK